MGGLGNQIFQYAAGLRLALRHRTELQLDVEFLGDRSPRPNFTYRQYELADFRLAERLSSHETAARFRNLLNRQSHSIFTRLKNRLTGRSFYLEKNLRYDPTVLSLPDNSYLEGYFQDERYFHDVAEEVRGRFKTPPRERLSPATHRLTEGIRSSSSIAIHVRRQDYITNAAINAIYGALDADYYVRGLAFLRQSGATGPVFIFSDDVRWCEREFRGENVTVVGEEHAGSRGRNHFWLMTQCRHFIIGNSSFAWWAAWLGERGDTLICRPNPWFLDPDARDLQICPERWIPLER